MAFNIVVVNVSDTSGTKKSPLLKRKPRNPEGRVSIDTLFRFLNYICLLAQAGYTNSIVESPKKIRRKFKEVLEDNPKLKKLVGVLFIVIGAIGVVTPFTPFAFLLIVGLGILGVRLAFWEHIKDRFKKK